MNLQVSDEVDAANIEEKAGWPFCPYIDGNCLGHDTSQRTGPATYDELMTFIWTAEEGSRLTLQKNRNGFSIQVTGALHRPPVDATDLAFLRDVRKTLDESDEQI